MNFMLVLLFNKPSSPEIHQIWSGQGVKDITSGDNWRRLLLERCLSCHQINSVKLQKGTKNSDANNCNGPHPFFIYQMTLGYNGCGSLYVSSLMAVNWTCLRVLVNVIRISQQPCYPCPLLLDCAECKHVKLQCALS